MVNSSMRKKTSLLFKSNRDIIKTSNQNLRERDRVSQHGQMIP